MAQDNNWWQDVERIIRERSMLKHPFYQAWQAGRLSMDDLRYYAQQYYPHVACFPRYVSAVHSNLEDIASRQVLLENLIEEEKGEHHHPELWLRFAEGIGLSRREVLSARIQPETVECIGVFMGLARSPNPLIGLSALYAYESQIPAVSATKMRGLREFYGVTASEALAFFDVHKDADVWHSKAERRLLQRDAREERDRTQVKRAVEKACQAVWKLLDGVIESREICASC